MLSWMLLLALRCAEHGPDLPSRVEELVGEVPGARVTFIVDAAPETVLQLLWDVTRFRSIFPDVKQADIIAKRGDAEVDVSFVVDAVVANVAYTLRRTKQSHADGGTIRWRSIAGDLNSIAGGWTVTRHGQAGSKVVYDSYVDPGGPSFVKSAYRDIALGKLNGIISRVRAALPAPVCAGTQQ
jgi:ribosome-associated toxin RatA of RatAB toxin-antitoxin module